jgi:hypothetical protein
VEPAVRELLKQTPTMPVTVIAERIGWEGADAPAGAGAGAGAGADSAVKIHRQPPTGR